MHVTTTRITGARRIGTRGEPVDVLIREGRVASVTPVAACRTAGSGTAGADEVVDADGAWIGPGLWDHHTHFDQWALVRRRLDVSACDSAAAVARRVAAASATEDHLLVAFGFRDGLWPDAAHRDLLDGALRASGGPDLPVVVISADLHAVWCNTAALVQVGASLGRDWRAHPTGLLREQDAFDVATAISAVPDDILDRWAGDAVDAAAARGIVGVVDLEMAFGLDRWTRRMHDGVDGVRVRSGVYGWDLDEALDRGLRTGTVVPGTHGLLAMGPFKIISDGSLNTRTAAVDEPYAGLHGDGACGLFAYPAEEVVALVRNAVAGGLVPAVHAIGDAANARALDVFEAVGTTGTIEHAQLLRWSDVERFARLGVTASVQPEHAMDDRDVADRYWAGRTDRAFPLAALSAAGVELRLGSDAPVAPLDPWVAMAAAVGRDRDGRAPWIPEQRIPPLAAWRASTGGRAALAVGDVADLVLVERDPLAATSAHLRGMHVLGTAVGGRWTFRSV